MRETLSAPKKWNELGQAEQSSLIDKYGAPYKLTHLVIEIGSNDTGPCDDNEMSLSACMFLDASRPLNDPKSLIIRNEMRNRHGLNLIGPFIAWSVGSFYRVITAGLVIDANNNIIYPEMLYGLYHEDMLKLANLIDRKNQVDASDTVLAIKDAPDTQLTLRPVRLLKSLSYLPRSTQLVSPHGDNRPLEASSIGPYVTRILLNELREEGKTHLFYQHLSQRLPEIFSNEHNLVAVTSEKHTVTTDEVGNPTDLRLSRDIQNKHYMLIQKGEQIKAYPDPLNTLRQDDKQVYIVKNKDGKFFFIPKSELSRDYKQSV